MWAIWALAAITGLIDPNNAPPLTADQVAAIDAASDCLKTHADMYDDEVIDAHELAKLIQPMCQADFARENAAMTANDDKLTKERYLAERRKNELHDALLAVLFERSQARRYGHRNPSPD